MLNCMVDGQSQDVMVREGVGLGDVIGTMNSEEIEVSSENCPGMALSDADKLESTTGSTELSAREILADACDFLSELHRFVLETAGLYRAGDEIKASEHFMELIQGMEWFVKVTASIEARLDIDFTSTLCAGQTLSDSVDGLNRILMDIIVAQEQRDMVLQTDLLEYELAPQLELWQDIYASLRQKS